jgi:hypothetical protein
MAVKQGSVHFADIVVMKIHFQFQLASHAHFESEELRQPPLRL